MPSIQPILLRRDLIPVSRLNWEKGLRQAKKRPQVRASDLRSEVEQALITAPNARSIPGATGKSIDRQTNARKKSGPWSGSAPHGPLKGSSTWKELPPLAA